MPVDDFEVVFLLAMCELARTCCKARKEGEAALNRASEWLAKDLSSGTRL